MKRVEDWWNAHVVTGISPAFDEKRDEEILKALRTNTLSPDTDIQQLISEAEQVKKRLDEASAAMAEDEKRYKKLVDVIKKHAMEQFRDGDKKVSVKGSSVIWEVSRSDSQKIDEEALAADGLLEKYKTKLTTTYRVTAKSI